MNDSEDVHHRKLPTSMDGDDEGAVELTETLAKGNHNVAESDSSEDKPLVDELDDEEYEQDEHGLPNPGTASNAQVAVNTIISFVGAGLLGISQAFSHSGWLLGSVLLCTVSALNVYAMLLLPQTRNFVEKSFGQRCHDYGTLGSVVLGPAGGTFVNVCLVISQSGFATAYIIFIAANLYSIYETPRYLTCFGCIPGLALLVQVQEMKSLAPFSLLADVANLLGLSAVLFQDWENYEPHNDTIHAVRWNGVLYVIAITIYSMEGVGLILSLETSAKNRSQFPLLFKTVLGSITLFMAFFGSAGYMAFGENTQAPITLNLADNSAAAFVKISLCVALYLTYPVMMFPIWHITKDLLPEHGGWFLRAFRTSVVVLTSLVAYSVPDFGKFLSLVGSSICTILGFILPCYFHLVTCKDEIPRWQYALDLFLIIGGILFGLMGTFQSFIDLFEGN